MGSTTIDRKLVFSSHRQRAGYRFTTGLSDHPKEPRLIRPTYHHEDHYMGQNASLRRHHVYRRPSIDLLRHPHRRRTLHALQPRAATPLARATKGEAGGL